MPVSDITLNDDELDDRSGFPGIQNAYTEREQELRQAEADRTYANQAFLSQVDEGQDPLDEDSINHWLQNASPLDVEQNVWRWSKKAAENPQDESSQRMIPLLEAFVQTRQGERELPNLENYINQEAIQQRAETERNVIWPLLGDDVKPEYYGLEQEETLKALQVATVMSIQLDKPIEEVARNYDSFLAYWGGANGMKDVTTETALARMKADRNKAMDLAEKREEVSQAAYDSLLAGESAKEAYARMGDAATTLGGAEVKRIMRSVRSEVMKQYWNEIPEASKLLDPWLKGESGVSRAGKAFSADEASGDALQYRIWDYVEGFKNTPEQNESIMRLAAMDDKQQDKVLGLMYRMAELKGGELGGMAEEFGENFFRAVGDSVENIWNTYQESQEPGVKYSKMWKDAVKRGQIKPSDIPWADKEAQALRRLRTKMRNIRNIAQDIRGDNLGEKLLYGISANVHYAAMAAIPYAGIPLLAGDMTWNNFTERMNRYPDMNEEDAWRMSKSMGMVQGAVERLAFKTWWSGFPRMSAFFARHGGKFAIYSGRVGGAVATEYTEEIIQSAVVPLGQEIYSWFKDEIPEVTREDWQENFFQYHNEGEWLPFWDAETMIQVAGLAVLMSGGKTAYDHFKSKNVADMLSDVDRVMLSGFTRAEAERIANEKDPFVKFTMFQEGGQSMPVEERKQNSIAAAKGGAGKRLRSREAKQHLDKMEERARKSGDNQEVVGVEFERDRMEYHEKFDPEITENPDGGWDVAYPEETGKPTENFETLEEAAESTQDYFEEVELGFLEEIGTLRQDLELKAKLKEAAQKHEGMDIEEDQELEQIYDFAQKGEAQMQSALERMEHQFNLLGRELGMDREEMLERMKKVKTLGEVRIKQRARGSVIRLSKEATSADMAEEMSEGFLGDLIEHGVIEADWVKNQIFDIQQKTGRRLTTAASPAEMSTLQMKEAWSDLVKANFYNHTMGEAEAGMLAPLIKALRYLFRAVLGIAKDLKALQEKGLVDEDFQSYMDQAVGLNMEQQVEREAGKARGEILGDASQSISDPDFEEGRTVSSPEEAEKLWSDGKTMYAFIEQDEEFSLIRDKEMFDNHKYSPDRLLWFEPGEVSQSIKLAEFTSTIASGVGDQEANLKKKKARRKGTGVGKNKAMRLEVDGKPLWIGAQQTDQGKPFKAWVEETEAWYSDEEINDAAVWYDELHDLFVAEFGEDDAPMMMLAWLSGQQNESPGGAVRNLFRVKDRIMGILHGKKGGLADEKLLAALQGEIPAGGYGPKLADFVDAGMGKTTRTYMGDSQEGGQPFVADVHTGRDSGHVDQQSLTRIKKSADAGRLTYNGKPVKAEVTKSKTVTVGGQSKVVPEELTLKWSGGSRVVKRDLVGSPSENVYEGISEWGNNLTDYLNKIQWMGRNDWTPKQAQAVGWMRTLRQYGLKESTLRSSLDENTYRISAEVDYGLSSKIREIYPDFHDLPDDTRAAITKQVMDTIIPLVQEIVAPSAIIRGVEHGKGYWQGSDAPSAQFWVMGSDEAAGIIASALAHITEQAGTARVRFGMGGKNKRAVVLPDMTEEQAQQFIDWVEEAKGSSDKAKAKDAQSIDGASTRIMPGQAGLVMFGLTQASSKRVIASLERFTEESGINLDFDDVSAEATFHGNDWQKDPEGSSYREDFKRRGGQEEVWLRVVGLRRDYAETLEEAFGEHAPGAVDPSGRQERIDQYAETGASTTWSISPAPNMEDGRPVPNGTVAEKLWGEGKVFYAFHEQDEEFVRVTSNEMLNSYDSEMLLWFEPDEISMSISPAQDADYLAAVESGDVETQQRMVDEAAELATRVAMVPVDSLIPTEDEGDKVRPVIDEIKESFKDFDTDLWDEVPAIIVTPDLKIRDGHHRVIAFKELGFNEVRTIIVPQEVYDTIGDQSWIDPLVAWASEAVGDNTVTGAQYGIPNVTLPSSVADPVTYDSDGNVIPLSKRFDAGRDKISRSIQLEEDSDPVMNRLRALMNDPDSRLQIYQMMQERVTKLREDELERRIFTQGLGGEQDADISKKRTVASLRKEAKERGILPGVRVVSLKDHPKGYKYAVEAFEDNEWKAKKYFENTDKAYFDAQKEAKELQKSYPNPQENWVQEQLERQQIVHSPEAVRSRSLGTLQAILSVLPPEVRGRIRGIRDVLEAKNQKTADQKFAELLDKIDKQIERFLKKEYIRRIRTLEQRATGTVDPKTRRRKGKITAENHEIAEQAKRAKLMSPEKAQEEIDSLREELDKMDFESEEEFFTLDGKIMALELFYDFNGADSARLAKAYEFLQSNYQEGRKKWLQELKKRKDIKDSRVGNWIAHIGGGYIGREKTTTPEKARRKSFLSGANEWVLQLLGSKWSHIARILENSKDKAGARKAFNEAFDSRIKAETETQLEQEQVTTEFFDFIAKMLGKKKLTKHSVRKFLYDAKKQTKDHGITSLEGRKVDTIKVPMNAVEPLLSGDIGSVDGYVFTSRDLMELQRVYDNYLETREGQEQEGKRKTSKRTLSISKIQATGERLSIGSMSQAELLNLWLTMRQRDQFEKLEKIGYDQTTMEQLEKSLTPEMKAAGLYMVRHLAQEGKVLSKIHADEYGVALITHDNYFPVHNIVSQDQEPMDPGTKHAGRNVSPGALKARVPNLAEPDLAQDAFAVFFGHVAEMTYWKHNVQWVREWGNVFRDPNFAKQVRSQISSQAYSNLLKVMESVQNRGAAQGQTMLKYEKLLKLINKRFALGVLGARMSTVVVNTTAVFNAFGTNETTARRILTNMAKMAFDSKGELKATWNNDLQKMRRTFGASFEASLAMSRDLNQRPIFQDLDAAAQLGLAPMNYADVATNSITVAAIYRAIYDDHIEAGVDEEAARKAAQDAVTRSIATLAQPVLPSSRSFMEDKASFNPVYAMFAMFRSEIRKNAGNNYLAWRALLTGKGLADRKTAGRQVALWTVVYPAMVTLFRELLHVIARDEDDEDFWKRVASWEYWTYGMASDTLRAIPVVGDIAAGVIGRSLDQKVYASSTPLERAFRTVAFTDFGKDFSDESELTPGEQADKLVDLAQAATLLPGGMVLSQAANVAEFVKGVGFKESERPMLDQLTDLGTSYARTKLVEHAIENRDAVYEETEDNKERWSRLAEIYHEIKQSEPELWPEVEAILKEKSKLPQAVERKMKYMK